MSKLLAPNGKPSNLTPEQYKLVRTPAFKKWFGDWEKLENAKIRDSGIDEITLSNLSKNVSKVVDENGEPLVCYHGSEENFTIFDINKISKNTGNYGHYGYGFYFSEYIKEAQGYGNNIFNCFLKILKPFLGTNEEFDLLKENGIGNIDEKVIVSIDFSDLYTKIKDVDSNAYHFMTIAKKNGIKNVWDNYLKSEKKIKDKTKIDLNDLYQILLFTDLEPNEEHVPNYILDDLREIGISPKYNLDYPYPQQLHWVTNLGDNSKEFTDLIQKYKYDGVIWGTEFVAFNSTQIKLANGTNTTFDTNNPDIRYKQGGKIKTYWYKGLFN